MKLRLLFLSLIVAVISISRIHLALASPLAKVPPPAATAPDDAAMDPCTAHLQAIGTALAAYEKDHGQLPDQLSDLFPKYIADRAIFHCPADPTEGDPARDFAHRDPNMKMSYSYDWSADESHGLPQPMGPFPKPDIGNAWGTCRLVSERQAHFFGDRVPVVRCFHHKTEESEAAKVLSLTRSGQVYRSHGVWEGAPETFTALLDCVARDLQEGDKTFLDNWSIGPLAYYIQHQLDESDSVAAAMPKLAPLAAALEQYADRNMDSEIKGAARVTAGNTAKLGLRTASRLRLEGGDPASALKDFSRVISVAARAGACAPGESGADGNAQPDPDVSSDLRALARIYRLNHQPELALLMMLAVHKANLKISIFMTEIADLHDDLHNPAAAERWRDRAEPSRRLVGNPAPDFTASTPTGEKATLSELLRGKKATIIDFFFVGCGPCRAQAPQLQKLYAKLADQGLQVLAVDHGDSPDAVANFAKKFELTHPVLVGGEAKPEDPQNLFARYRVRAYPTTYLIDDAGRILWQSVGYEGEGIPTLKKELEKLGLHP